MAHDAMNRLLDWTGRGLLPAARLEELGHATGLLPDRMAWRAFLDRLLLVAGALALGSALVFFVAANWSLLGAYARFALAQVAVLLGVGAYWRWGDGGAGRAGLGFAVLAFGALLALYGQTYQTGADPWQLFATWALLALPWTWLANSAGLWLFWLLLVNLALLRWLSLRIGFWSGLSEFEWFAWTIVLLQAGALLLAEWLALRGFQPGRARWALQLLLLAALAALTSLTVLALFEDVLKQGALALLAWLGALAAGWWAYRRRTVDVLALAFLALSAVVVLGALSIRVVGPRNLDNPFAWLLVAGVLIGLTTTAGRWLVGVARRAREQEA